MSGLTWLTGRGIKYDDKIELNSIIFTLELSGTYIVHQ